MIPTHCGSACKRRRLVVHRSARSPAPAELLTRGICNALHLDAEAGPDQPVSELASLPACRTEVVPVGNRAPVAALKLATGGTVNRPLELAVWFCENCGEKSPRFG